MFAIVLCKSHLAGLVEAFDLEYLTRVVGVKGTVHKTPLLSGEIHDSYVVLSFTVSKLMCTHS